MKRGDIYWVDLNPTQGAEIKKKRPCIIIGATPINQVRRTIVVIPLSTSAKARPPITIAVSCLGKQVTAVCDQIRAIDRGRIEEQAGHLSEKDLAAVGEGIRQVLSL